MKPAGLPRRVEDGGDQGGHGRLAVGAGDAGQDQLPVGMAVDPGGERPEERARIGGHQPGDVRARPAPARLRADHRHRSRPPPRRRRRRGRRNAGRAGPRTGRPGATAPRVVRHAGHLGIAPEPAREREAPRASSERRMRATSLGRRVIALGSRAPAACRRDGPPGGGRSGGGSPSTGSAPASRRPARRRRRPSRRGGARRGARRQARQHHLPGPDGRAARARGGRRGRAAPAGRWRRRRAPPPGRRSTRTPAARRSPPAPPGPAGRPARSRRSSAGSRE